MPPYCLALPSLTLLSSRGVSSPSLLCPHPTHPSHPNSFHFSMKLSNYYNSDLIFNKYIKIRIHSFCVTETSHTYTHTVCAVSMNCTILQARNLAVTLSPPSISSMHSPIMKFDQSFSEISFQSDHSYPSPTHSPTFTCLVSL